MTRPRDCRVFQTTIAALLVAATACNRSSSNGDSKYGPAEPAPECSAIPTGSADLVRPGSITVFGELHGTNEAPRFVADLACSAADGARVVVGIELPGTMNPALQLFLASDGSDEARRALLADRFWNTEDGRSSRAMLALVDTVRRLKRAGRSADVFAFDGRFGGAGARDRGMAANLVERLGALVPAKTVVSILTGNLHARASTERWMGWHLRERYPALRTLNNHYSGGEAWACTPDGCGSIKLRGRDRGTERLVELTEQPDENGYDGVFYFGHASASQPARAKQSRR